MKGRPPDPAFRRRRLFGAAALVAALLCAPSQAAEPVAADTVKAAFLYKFVPFVEWPAAASGGPAAPVTICIVGADPFGPTLEQQVAAEHIGPRPIVVRTLPIARAHSGCQVMYLAGSDVQSVGQALKIVRGEPVLTVTDEAAAKGIVDFTVMDGRVRFRINEQSAAENGLRLRSTLLALAVSVVRERGAR